MMAQIMLAVYSFGATLAARSVSWWKQRSKDWTESSVAHRNGRELPPSRSRNPVWIHAASMGEVRVGTILASALYGHGTQSVISAMTETGFDLASREGGEGSLAIRAPFDLCSPVKNVLAAYTPSALVIIETELWPNMLREAMNAGLPVFVVNGRISDRAFPKYRITNWFWKPLLEGVTRFYMRSEVDAQRIIAIGADSSRVEVCGSLKSAVIPRASDATFNRLAALGYKGHRVWIAGSTRPGEEEMILQAHRILRQSDPELKLWIAPRHPERFEEVAALLLQSGFTLSRWSTDVRGSDHSSDILLVDAMGVLAELYEFACVAFVGGSLKPFGGHNPLEPALVGTPVVVGPYTETQRESVAWLKTAGLITEVADAKSLAAAARPLIANDDESGRRRRATLARSHSTGAADRIAHEIVIHIRGKNPQ